MLKRKEWFYVSLPLIFTWGLDRITKLWALDIQGMTFYGPIGLVLHFNHGAMLGMFSDLPPILRIVSLSTGGAFLLFTYAVIQFMLPIKSMTLRMGMSFLIGGILGNVADRIVWGYVVDFIIMGTPKSFSPAYNIADALQWVGYIMIVWALIREGDILWPANNYRKQIWVNPSFQIKYCMILMGVGFGLSLIAGVYSYTYSRVIITDLVGGNPRILDKFLDPFVITFAIISVFFGIVLFMLGRILSHRTAGPIYAFEKYLEDLMNGKVRPLKLRTKDEFKHLEQIAAQLSNRMVFDQTEINRLKALVGEQIESEVVVESAGLDTDINTKEIEADNVITMPSKDHSLTVDPALISSLFAYTQVTDDATGIIHLEGNAALKQEQVHHPKPTRRPPPTR